MKVKSFPNSAIMVLNQATKASVHITKPVLITLKP